MDSYNLDLHIHSKYSGGVSDQMTLPIIAEQAKLKGLHAVATGDCLHNKWLKHLEENLTEIDEGVYQTKNSSTKFILQTEIEDEKRVHHIIFLPSLEAARKLRHKLSKHSKNIDADGRPNIHLVGDHLIDEVETVGGIVGPSHAFTPWTAVYKEYETLAECYKKNIDKVHFLELGLSADTNIADTIPELKNITFLTNSDCHSPWPHRLGREFNRMELKKITYPEIVKALTQKSKRRISLNIGLNPNEGKYHETACTRCYTLFHWSDALTLKRRCPECGGIIKKGVTERIKELSQTAKPVHPTHRPPYIHILPLAEVISLATGVKTLTSKKIQGIWAEMISLFQNEIHILIDQDTSEIKKYNPQIGKIIEKFRTGRINYHPGGGGKYGKPSLQTVTPEFWGSGQKNLTEY